MASLTNLRKAAIEDIRRWLAELDGTSPRATLSIGVLQRAFTYAEELLRESIQVYITNSPEALAEAIRKVTDGKVKRAAKLTFGQSVHVLQAADRTRRLAHGRKLITKADKNLLDETVSRRNAFVHGSAVSELDAAAACSILQLLLKLAEMRVVCVDRRCRPAVSAEADRPFRFKLTSQFGGS